MYQKAHIEAFRAMAISTFYQVDVRKNSSEPERVQYASNMVEVNTPLVKAYCSDYALDCISAALQIYGGYGFQRNILLPNYIGMPGFIPSGKELTIFKLWTW